MAKGRGQRADISISFVFTGYQKVMLTLFVYFRSIFVPDPVLGWRVIVYKLFRTNAGWWGGTIFH